MNSHNSSKPRKPEPPLPAGITEPTGWGPEAESPSGKPAHLDAELLLNQLLEELPDAPLSSNFTHRVMQQIQLERRAARRTFRFPFLGPFLHLAWPRKLAVAASFLAVGLLSYQQYQMSVRRDLAQSIASLSSVVHPTLEVFQDFSAIQGFRQVSLSVPSEETDLMDAMK